MKKLTFLLKGWLVSLAALFVLTATAAPSFGQVISPQVRSLRGLKGICVSVDKMPPALAAAGISEKAVRADIEGRLKHAGIAVVPAEAFTGDRNLGKLAFHVAVMPAAALLAYFVNVDLYQNMELCRGEAPVETEGATWQKTNGGLVGTAMADLVRAAMTERADSFISDYAEANAPEPPAKSPE